MQSFAANCTTLTALSAPDTSKLTSCGINFMREYAAGCSNLASLGAPDTSKIASAGDFFLFAYAAGCSSLMSLAVPDTSGLASAGDYFLLGYAAGCSSLRSLAAPDTSGLASAGNFFMASYAQSCTSLASLNVPDVSMITSAGYSFMYCYATDCTSLTSLDAPATSSLDYAIAGYLCEYAKGCVSLTSLGIPDTTAVVYADTAFMVDYADGCTSLDGFVMQSAPGWFASNDVDWSVPAAAESDGPLTASVPRDTLADWQALTATGRTLEINRVRSASDVGSHKATVSFDVRGGTPAPSSRTVLVGDPVGALPEPSRAHYTFDGWFTAATGGEMVTPGSIVTGNATYYAHWTPVSYTVTWDAQEGTASATRSSIDYGSAVGALPTASRAGYTFGGWYTAPAGGSKVTAGTIVTGDATYYARWTPVQASDQLTDDVPGAEGTDPPAPGETVQLPSSVDFGDGGRSGAVWTVGGSDPEGVRRLTDKYGYDIGAVPDGSVTIGPDGKLTVTADVEGRLTLTVTSKADPSKKRVVTIVIARNVTKIRTPYPSKTLYFTKSRKAAPPIAFDGKDASGKAWGYGATAKVYWKVTTAKGRKAVKADAKTGRIKAKKVGAAKVTVTSLNGKARITYTYRIVKKARRLGKLGLTRAKGGEGKALKIKGAKATIKKGKTAALRLKLTSKRATNIQPTFTVAKKYRKYLKVDKAGKIFTYKKGTARIKVKAGGRSRTVRVRVR
jgi:uncharacterized repeat protein (TIGR02543 family)